MCDSLKHNKKLKYFYLRNCKFGDRGSLAIANLIDNNNSIQELEIFNCAISDDGGYAIGRALEKNFRVGKLSIGDNKLNKKDVDSIQQSVIFNTQYNQLKESNKKFQEFAHSLIAESLKKWASQSSFVSAKLEQKLSLGDDFLDEMDKKIATHYFTIKNANSSQYLDLMKECGSESNELPSRRVTKK